MDNEQMPSNMPNKPSNGFSQTFPADEVDPDFSQPPYPIDPDFSQPSYPIDPDFSQPPYPIDPDFSQPSYPIDPDFSQPGFPGGVIGPVVIPIYPGGLKYAQVRFLHAAAGYPPITISIGPRLISNMLSYENLTSYTRINSGFRTITIAEASNPRNIIFRKSITFVPGSQVTVAVTNAANGLQLITVNDQLCTNKSIDTGCLRFVNLSYGSGSFDVSLDNGETVFSDIEFTEISPFKQAGRGRYRINVYEASPGIRPRMNFDPLLTFPLTIMGNEMYTVYLIGSTFATPALSPVIVANA